MCIICTVSFQSLMEETRDHKSPNGHKKEHTHLPPPSPLSPPVLGTKWGFGTFHLLCSVLLKLTCGTCFIFILVYQRPNVGLEASRSLPHPQLVSIRRRELPGIDQSGFVTCLAAEELPLSSPWSRGPVVPARGPL